MIVRVSVEEVMMQKDQPGMGKVLYRNEEKLSQAIQKRGRCRKSRTDMPMKKAKKLGNAMLSNCLRQ